MNELQNDHWLGHQLGCCYNTNTKHQLRAIKPNFYTSQYVNKALLLLLKVILKSQTFAYYLASKTQQVFYCH